MTFAKIFYGPIIGFFGIALSIFAGFNHKGWSLLVYSLSSAFAFSIAIFLMYLIAIRRKHAFFGWEKGAKINLVIPSYWNRNEYDPKAQEKEYRYYKKSNGEKTWLIGATTYPLTSTGGTSLACNLTALIACEVTREIEVKGDEEDLRNVIGTKICIGSPTSNTLTGKVLNVLPQNRAITFTSKTMKCWLSDEPCVATTQYDFAILARMKYQSDIHFVCAGIDEEGSVAAGRLLASKWKSLPNDNFVIVYKVEKNSFDAEECVKIINQNGEWVNF